MNKVVWGWVPHPFALSFARVGILGLLDIPVSNKLKAPPWFYAYFTDLFHFCGGQPFDQRSRNMKFIYCSSSTLSWNRESIFPSHARGELAGCTLTWRSNRIMPFRFPL